MRSRLLTHALLTSCSGASLLLASAFHAQALPTGGQVETGSATITQTDANNLVIDQHTDRAIINWQNFNIGSGQTTRFNQPGASSVALNRVLDGNPTQILGNLSANGRVFIVNPNGVIFGAGSRVDVAGLVAATANIRSADFMAGQYHFSQAGRRDARIVNEGNISAKDGGLVALVAPSVQNNGVITARMGTVAIGAAQTVALDFYGDNLYGFKLGEQAEGAGAGVSNTGTIAAQGGRVLISAKTAQDVVNQAINLEGVVDATSMREVNGEIIIDGGEGAVRVTGTLNASGKNTGEKGGRVQVTGKKITLAGATVDASGAAGGGDVRIGGDKKGGGTIARADYVDVDSASLIDVSATDNGNGGSSVVWSDIATNFYGRLRGRGGDNGGNGGFAEVSSKTDLSYNSAADLSAAKGNGGHLLIDPLNFVLDALNVAGFIATLNGGTNVTFETNVAGADAGDITIDAAMNWSGTGSLVLNAVRDIIVNQSITNTSASGGNVTFNTGTTGGSGNVTLNNGANINLANGSAVFNVNGGEVQIADADIFANGVSFNSPVNYVGTAGATRQIRAGAGTFSLIGTASGMNIGDRFMNIVADNMDIQGAVTGSGTLYIRGHDINRSIGLAGETGDLNLTSAELDLLQTGGLSIGDPEGIALGTGQGNIRVGAYNWLSRNDLSFHSNGGSITFVGAQDFTGTSSTTIRAHDYNINANLVGDGALTLTSLASSLTVGGAAGATIIDGAELDRIQDGFSQINIGGGRTLNLTIQSYNNWRDPVRFQNRGNLTVNGAQSAAAGSNANLLLNQIGAGRTTTVNANLDFSGSTTGGVTFAPSTDASSVVQLAADVISGADGITIDRAVNLVGAVGTARVLNARTGAITINNDGVSNFGQIAVSDKALVLNADNMTIGGNISGTGSVYFSPHTAGRTMGLAGGAGALQLSSAELNRIQPGFTDIYFGLNPHGVMGITGGYRAGALDIGARNWGTPAEYLLFASQADITVSGNQNFGNARTTFMSSNTDYRILANLAGTNQLQFRNSNVGTDLSIGGAVGTTDLDSSELDRIQDGFSTLVFGDGSAGSITFHAYNNWRDAIDVWGAGANSVIGTQSAAAGSNASIRFINLPGSTLDINGDIDFSASTTGGVQLLHYGAGTNPVNLAANIASGIDGITIDRAVNLVGAGTRTLNARSGTLAINNDGVNTFGSINASAGNLTLIADNMTLNGAITGALTTVLRIRQFTAGRTMGIAGGAGDLNLTNAELDNIAANLNTVLFGERNTTGAMDIGARNWQVMDHAIIFNAFDPITVSGAQTFTGGTHVFYDTRTGYNVNANIAGDGIAGFGNGMASGLTVGGAVGTTILDSAELDRLQNGFSEIYIGGGNDNAITMQAYNNWRDAVRLNGGVGSTNTIAGAQVGIDNSSFEVAQSTTNINANLDFSGSSTGGIRFSRFPLAPTVVNLAANIRSGVDGITIDRAVNLIGAAGTIRRIDAGTGAVTINNDGVNTFGSINGADKNLRLFGTALNLNGSTISSTSGNVRFEGGSVTLTNGQINSTSGDILLNNTGVFFSSLADSLVTGGTGTITLNQIFGGSINNAIAVIANSGTGQNTVNVGNGIFVENVVMDHNNLRLRSINGRNATTITGISGVGALGTIVVLNNVNNSQIGGLNRGFTINGIDNGNPAIENAAIYYQGNHNTALVRGNRIVAMGDSALVTEYGLNNANFTIDGNIITGNTFTGADGAWGVGNQFVVPNVPRQLVAFNQGLSNVVFTNNQITGNSGTAHLVAIESAGTNVAGNMFNGLTYGAALRLRGSGVTVTVNTVDGSGRGRGMHISGVADSVFAYNIVANTDLGIWIDGSDNATITNSILINNITGVRINPSVSGLIDGVAVIGGTTGFEVVSSNDTTIQNSFVTDALTGISVSDSSGFIATNNVLNSNTITPTTNAGFDLVNTTGAQLTDNTVRGFRTGINFNGGSNGAVTGGIIRGADVAGINALNHVNLNVSGTNIRTTGTSAEGINLSGGSATIAGVDITTRGNGIYADGLTALSIKGSTVDAPSGQNGLYGIQVNNTPDAQIGGLGLGEGNTISNMDVGIAVSSSASADILGNTLNGDNNHTGIQVTDSANVVVRRNVLEALNDLGNVAFEFDAIRVLNSTYADIRQNILTAENGGQLTGRYGIYVDGSHGVRVRGNDLTANSGGTLAVSDAIRVTGSNYADIRNNDLIADGGTISQDGTAIHLLGTAFANVYRNDLTASNGGIIAGQDGIWAEWARGATINNNRIRVTGESSITPIGRDGIHVSFGGKGSGSVAEINNNIITAEDGNIVDRHGIHVEDYGNVYFVSGWLPLISLPFFAPDYTGGLVIDGNVINGTGADGIRVRGDYARVMDDSVGGGDDEFIEDFEGFDRMPPIVDWFAPRSPVQITNNRITNTGDDGIDSEGARNVIINDNRIRNAGGHGITADVVSEARRNNVRYTDDHGIFLRDSDNVQASENRVRDADEDGIRIQNSSFATLENNIVRDSDRGIHVLSVGEGVSDNVTLTGNTTYDNNHEGVRIRSGNNHTVTNNTSYDNGAQGFRLLGIGNSTISGNTATGNGAAGIRVEDSEVITITNNTSNGNLRGIRVLNGSNITVTDNITNDNRREGIRFDTVVNSPVVTANTMVGNLVGFAAYNGTDNLTLNGNIFTGNATGVLFNNSDNGRLEDTIIDIAAGGTGLLLENGAGSFIVRDVTFNGGEVAVLIDGGVVGDSIGGGEEEFSPSFSIVDNGPTGMQFESNNSQFNGNNFYFILRNGAMNGETLIATQQIFDGVRAANFSVAQRDAAEAKTIDVQDGFAVGDVFYRDFTFNFAALDQLAQMKGNPFGGDVFSYDGLTLSNNILLNNFQFDLAALNLSLLNPAAGGGNGGSAGDLNDLSTAGGGSGDKNASADQLNDLETAAGGNEDTCGNSFLGTGFEFGYNGGSCSGNGGNI